MAVIAPSRDADGVLRRQVMIDNQLRPSDVTDPRVLSAIAQIDREHYVPADRAAMAYADRAVPLTDARALNPVLTTARMIVDLAPATGSTLLLIGAATGYAAAVLAAMGVIVTAVEDDATLAEIARTTLINAANVTIIEGPLAAGAAATAPYDALMIDGCVEQIPAALLQQQRDGARMVSGLRDGAVTRIGRAVHVTGVDSVALLAFADMECVPLPGFAVPRHFQF
jgi:protein-L-isoaspartate(D-aspartate) O-methyltransferase